MGDDLERLARELDHLAFAANATMIQVDGDITGVDGTYVLGRTGSQADVRSSRQLPEAEAFRHSRGPKDRDLLGLTVPSRHDDDGAGVKLARAEGRPPPSLQTPA
jgi:hypothetical protein